MADKRRFSDDEFDDIDLTDEEIEYLNISFDDANEETEKEDEEEIHVEKSLEKKHRFLIPLIIAVIAVCVGAAVVIVKKTPSKVKVDLYEYYGMDEDSDRLAIAVNHKKADVKGYIIDNRYYIPEEIVEAYLTDKLYTGVANENGVEFIELPEC